MSTKHDESPWTLHRDQSGWYISPIEALLPFGDIQDLEAGFRPDGAERVVDPTGRYLANAMLVAAAPDLLAALKACAAVCAGETTTKNGLIDALEKARAAIAKATNP